MAFCFSPRSRRPQTLISEVPHYRIMFPVHCHEQIAWSGRYAISRQRCFSFSFSFLHLNNASVWKTAPSVLSFGSQIEFHKNFKSLCLKCYFTTYKALSIPGRESIWYLFSCFPVPGISDKLYYLILIIAPGGRT